MYAARLRRGVRRPDRDTAGGTGGGAGAGLEQRAGRLRALLLLLGIRYDTGWLCRDTGWLCHGADGLCRDMPVMPWRKWVMS